MSAAAILLTAPVSPICPHRKRDPNNLDQSMECLHATAVEVPVKSISSQCQQCTPEMKHFDQCIQRLALVLDMDECLVHSEFTQTQSDKRGSYQCNDTFTIKIKDGEEAIVRKRPGLDEFLEQARKQYDVYVFTAGLQAYGDPILNHLDPSGTLFSGRFFRKDCLQRKGMFLKDLNLVRRDLSRVILVDNNLVSFLLQPSNGIPVPSFYDDENDRTLAKLSKVLMDLNDSEDVRPRLYQLFRLSNVLAEHRRLILDICDT